MKKLVELRNLSSAELALRLQESKKELMKTRTQFATGASAPNPGKFRNTKKFIARLHMLMREKEVRQ